MMVCRLESVFGIEFERVFKLEIYKKIHLEAEVSKRIEESGKYGGSHYLFWF